jgi:hypothetical protein
MGSLPIDLRFKSATDPGGLIFSESGVISNELAKTGFAKHTKAAIATQIRVKFFIVQPATKMV